VGVGYIHGMTDEEVAKQSSVVPPSPAEEGKRVDLESGGAGILLQL